MATFSGICDQTGASVDVNGGRRSPLPAELEAALGKTRNGTLAKILILGG